MNMEEKDTFVAEEPATTQEPAPAAAKRNTLSFKENPARFITITAMVTALAFAIMFALRIKIFIWTIDFKDLVIVVSGFMFGPLVAVIASIMVPLLEMITVSSTLFWGMIMNIISSLTFALTATLIYKKMRNIKGAVIGIVAAVLATTIIMIPANLIVVPLYVKTTTQAVADMLLPYIIPFNLLKTSLNAGLIMLVYKPIAKAFRAARMIPVDIKPAGKNDKKTSIITLIAAAAAIVAVILFIALWVTQKGLNVQWNPPK